MVNVGEYTIYGSYGIDARNDGFSTCISGFKNGYFGPSMLNIGVYPHDAIFEEGDRFWFTPPFWVSMLNFRKLYG